jgi:uncharacterized protein (DUF433 family)
MGDRPRPTHAVRELRSFRLHAETASRLDLSAAASGMTRTALAERLLDEGLRRLRHPRIDFVDGPAGRRPFVLGTGLDVWEIVATIRANNGSVEESAAHLQVSPATVDAAARYHAEFADEIDRWIDSNEAMAEREERLYRQQVTRQA